MDRRCTHLSKSTRFMLAASRAAKDQNLKRCTAAPANVSASPGPTQITNADVFPGLLVTKDSGGNWPCDQPEDMQSSCSKKLQRLRTLSKLPPPAHVSDLKAAVREVCNFDSGTPSHKQIQILLDSISIAIRCGMQSDLSTALPPLRHLQRALSSAHASDGNLCSAAAVLVEFRSFLGGTDAGVLVDVPGQSHNRSMHARDTGNASQCSEALETGKSVSINPYHEDGLTREVTTTAGQGALLAVGTSIVPGPIQHPNTAQYQREVSSALVENPTRPMQQNHVVAEAQGSAAKICALMMEQAQQDHVCVRTVARVMWCCCHWGLDARLLFTRLQETTLTDLEQFSQFDIAATSWTCAMLSFPDAKVLQLLATEASRRLPIEGGELSLTLNQSSTVAWAFGQLNIREAGFWHRLTLDFPVLRSADGFAAPPAVVVRLLWGMALAGHRNVAVLDKVATWMNNGVQLQLCRSEYIAPIIRSFAMLQFSPEMENAGSGVLHTAAELIRDLAVARRQSSSEAIACVAALTSLRACSEELLTAVALASADRLHECSTRQILVMCGMLADASVHCEVLFQAAAETLFARIPHIDPPDMFHAVTAFRRLQMPLGPLLKAAQDSTLQHMLSCTPPEMCSFLTSLAEGDCDVTSIREALVNALLTAIPHLSAQQTVDVAWALATLQLDDAVLLSVLHDHGIAAVDQYTLGDLGTLTWAFAKLQRPSTDLCLRVTNRMACLLNQEAPFTATDLALLLWSFGKLGHSPSSKVLAQMQAAIITCLPQASPHAISMALTGYKSLPYRPRQLIQALNCLSQNDLLEFEPRHLSSALHALASMRLAPGEELFQSIITAAQLQQESFGPEEWANITWSLAWFAKHSRTLRDTARSAMMILAPSILPSVDLCTGKDCSRILWAFTSAQAHPGLLASALAAHAARHTTELSARSAATVLWALGHLLGSAASHKAVQAVVKGLVGRTCDLDSRGATACLSGLALLQPIGNFAALVSELDHACSRLLPHSKAWEIASHMTSLADLGHPATLLQESLNAYQRELLPAFAKLQPHIGISFLWALTVHNSCGRFEELAQVQQDKIYHLSPSYGLSEDALVRLYQVCQVQEQLTGRRFLPRGCKLSQRCTAAYRQLVARPYARRDCRGNAFSMCDLWVLGLEDYFGLQHTACAELHRPEAPTTVAEQRTSECGPAPALPHLMCSQPNSALPNLADALLPWSARSSDALFESEMARVVVVPQQWRVHSNGTPQATGGQELQLTGFAWMELAQIAARHPDCCFLLPGRMAVGHSGCGNSQSLNPR